jgi:hypothetical protein
MSQGERGADDITECSRAGGGVAQGSANGRAGWRIRVLRGSAAIEGAGCGCDCRRPGAGPDEVGQRLHRPRLRDPPGDRLGLTEQASGPIRVTGVGRRRRTWCGAPGRVAAVVPVCEASGHGDVRSHPRRRGSAWDWHRLVPELAGRGHDVVVPELPIADRSAGFAAFCATVVTAIGDRGDLVVVGHSYGAFTAPLIADKLPVRLIVLLTPMVPQPGERPGDWWGQHRFSRRGGDQRRAAVLPRRAGRNRRAGCGARPGPGQRGGERAVASERMAGRADEGAHRPPGPVLPGGLPAPDGADRLGITPMRSTVPTQSRSATRSTSPTG